MTSSDVNSDDYYSVLGVAKGATAQEIAKAYKKAAIRYHPDKNPDNKEEAEENFKKVSEAYEVLSNKEKRETYDRFGKASMNGQGGMPSGFSKQNADEIFAQFFGGQDPFSVLFGEMGGMGGMGKGGKGGGRGGGGMMGMMDASAFGGGFYGMPGQQQMPGAGPGAMRGFPQGGHHNGYAPY